MWSNQHTCHKVAKFGQVKQNHKLASTFKLDVAKVTRSEARAQHQAPSTKQAAGKQANKQQRTKKQQATSKQTDPNKVQEIFSQHGLVVA